MNAPIDPLQTAAVPPPSQPVTGDASTPVASFVHTVLLMLLMLAMGGYSAWFFKNHAAEATRMGAASHYVSTIVVQWLLFAYVWLGLRLRRVPLREILGPGWKSFDDALMDVVWAGGFFIVSTVIRTVIILGIAHARHIDILNGGMQRSMKAVEALVPHTRNEMLLAVVLACTAGFVEEVLYRGYLQRQFRALTGSAAVAIVLQGAMFTAGHLYQQEWTNIVNISLLGLMLGMLAHWRRNLRPGIIYHAGQDSIALLVLGFLSKTAK